MTISKELKKYLHEVILKNLITILRLVFLNEKL